MDWVDFVVNLFPITEIEYLFVTLVILLYY